MTFCPNCHMLYNITKDIKSINKKNLAKVDLIFQKFKNDEPLTEDDLKGLTLDDLKYDDNYDKMNIKTQKKFTSYIKAVQNDFFETKGGDAEEKEAKTSTKAYYICKACNKSSEEIKPGTIIYTKNFNISSTSSQTDYSYVKFDDILPRTRNYICPNTKCKTHKDSSLQEAVIIHNNMDQVIYVCCECDTSWLPTA